MAWLLQIEEVDDENQSLASLDREYTLWQADIAKTKADIETIQDQLAALQEQQSPVNEADILGQMRQLQVQKRDALSTVRSLFSSLRSAEHVSTNWVFLIPMCGLMAAFSPKAARGRMLTDEHHSALGFATAYTRFALLMSKADDYWC